jgi:hypothetical protein
LFKDFPQAAGQFFGDRVRREYELLRMQSISESESLRLTAESEFVFDEISGRNIFCRGFGFRFNAILPDSRNTGSSAVMTLYEPGLYDAMISLGNDAFLDAIAIDEWNEESVFYCFPFGEKCVVQIGNVRCIVSKQILAELSRGVRRLAEAWHKLTRALAEKRGTRGYQLVDDGNAYVLGSVHSDMWAAMLEFARSHQFDKDAGPWNIFYDTHAHIDIFTNQTQYMRAGHHAILATRPMVGRGERAPNSWLDVVWLAYPSAFDNANDFSRDGLWSANMTAAWLTEKFMPEVHHWRNKDDRPRWQKTLRRRTVESFEIESWWYSKRAIFYSEERPKTREGLASLTALLQRHYALRTSCKFPGEFQHSIDRALSRLLERTELSNWGYVRSKGNLSGATKPEIVAELSARIAEGPGANCGGSLVEYKLRAFGEIFDLSEGDLDSSDVEAVCSELLRLSEGAERENERLANYFLPRGSYPL